ncbi:hypothetical protein [Taibaiella soli]|uniref:DUF4488 domain-containing protein n=1 Tax=Taibaiella soli TaxID=1649169 RepID=A0A2W2BGC9_9BACT|nr:hypothetical protein [Taibaiella soli]PZF74947.1 hypothetical protein DN068_01750 [Taibaiella soli]
MFRSLLLTALLPFCFSKKAPDIAGVYRLAKGNTTFDDGSGWKYLRGAVVIEKIDAHSFRYFGAVTPKGSRTVTRKGIYEYIDGAYVSESPAGEQLAPGIEMTVTADTLFLIDKADNAVDSLVWVRIPDGKITNEWLQKGVDQSREEYRTLGGR